MALIPTPTSEAPPPVPSNLDLRAPAPNFQELAKRFDVVLQREDAEAQGTPPPVAVAPPVPEVPEPPQPTPPPEAEPDATPPTPPAPDAEPPPAQEDDGGIRTLSQLAAAHDVEESMLLDTIHITTEDGNDIPLSTVLSGYLAQPGAEQAAEERSGFEAQYEERATEQRAIHDEALMRVGHLAQVLQQNMLGSMPSPEEMIRLQTEDPQAFAEARLQQHDAQQRVGQAMKFLDDEYQKRGAEQDSTHAQWVKDESAKKLKIFPDLANEATRKQQETAISSYLGGLGFKAADIATLEDSRMYRVVRDALYGAKVRKAGAANIAAARDKGLTPPKPAPTARIEAPTNAQTNVARSAALRAHAKQTGSVADAAAVFRDWGI
jgi:hypothetical protein